MTGLRAAKLLHEVHLNWGRFKGLLLVALGFDAFHISYFNFIFKRLFFLCAQSQLKILPFRRCFVIFDEPWCLLNASIPTTLQIRLVFAHMVGKLLSNIFLNLPLSLDLVPQLPSCLQVQITALDMISHCLGSGNTVVVCCIEMGLVDGSWWDVYASEIGLGTKRRGLWVC